MSVFRAGLIVLGLTVVGAALVLAGLRRPVLVGA
jgi:hypothetical protein